MWIWRLLYGEQLLIIAISIYQVALSSEKDDSYKTGVLINLIFAVGFRGLVIAPCLALFKIMFNVIAVYFTGIWLADFF